MFSGWLMPTCSERRVGEGVRRVVRARRVAHHDRRRRCPSPAARRASRPSSRSPRRRWPVLLMRARSSAHLPRIDAPSRRVADAGHEAEAVDQLAAGREVVAGAQAVDDRLRPQLVGAVAHHRVVALVLAGEEVLRRAAVVRAEAAAVVPVGAGEEPPVAAFAEQRVPHAADLRAVDAGAAVGGAADACRSATPPMLLRSGIVLAAVVRGAVAGLRLDAERDRRRGVVEVAQVLDVEAVVAVRVERAGALEVRGHVVAAVGMELRPSTSALRPSCCGRGCRCRRRRRGSASAAVAFQLGSVAFRLPGTEQFQLLAAPRLVSVSPRSKQYSHCASAVALPSAV